MEKEDKKSMVVLESLGGHLKRYYLSFIGGGEPLKGTDQQRNGKGCCALNWQNEEDQPEKGKLRGRKTM